MELEISWPNNGTESIGEWLKARDVASSRCVAMGGYAMGFIIFTPALASQMHVALLGCS
jgi:hypothetical protein